MGGRGFSGVLGRRVRCWVSRAPENEPKLRECKRVISSSSSESESTLLGAKDDGRVIAESALVAGGRLGEGIRAGSVEPLAEGRSGDLGGNGGDGSAGDGSDSGSAVVVVEDAS